MHFENAGSVQFGEHQPISLEEARRRTWEHEANLRERYSNMEALKEEDDKIWRQRGAEGWPRQKGRVMHEGEGRRESAPYPENNLIPTEGGIVRGSRPRGLSAPNVDEAVGLGVNLG